MFESSGWIICKYSVFMQIKSNSNEYIVSNTAVVTTAFADHKLNNFLLFSKSKQQSLFTKYVISDKTALLFETRWWYQCTY